MSRDEITTLLERGAGPAPDGPDVEQVWRRGRRRRALKRTVTPMVAVAAVAVIVLAVQVLVDDPGPRVDIGPVATAPPPVLHEVEVPDVEADRAELAALEGRTGAVVVAVRDGQADLVQVDSGQVTARDLPELAPGDPLYRIVDGDRLVLYGGGTIYAMDPTLEATPEPIVETGAFAVFVPSGVDDRIWVREGRTDGAGAEVRQVDMAGATLLGPSQSPGGNLVVGLRDTVVLQRDDHLVVWDPTTEQIIQQVDGPFPMGTDGHRYAWCDADCNDLHLADPQAGTTTPVARLPDGFSFVGYAGRISPDGRYLAAPVCVDGPDGRCALAVLDLRSDRAWTVADGWPTPSAPAWSPDSRWVFTTLDDGRLAAYRPGDPHAALVDTPELDRVLGLGVIGAARADAQEPAAAIRLEGQQIRTIAYAPTDDTSLEGEIVDDGEALAEAWQAAQMSGSAPDLPDGTVGVFVIARQAESTCRSPDDVVAVEIVDEEVQVLLDREGEFMRQCPGPLGAHAFTAFVVAIPDTYADQVDTATTRLVTRENE